MVLVTGLLIDRLEPHMAVEFEQLVQIYTEALPKSERKSVSELRRMLSNPAYEFLIARVDGAVVGFSTLVALSHTNVGLLEYMAVSSQKRSMGIGGSLFRRAVSSAAATSRYVLLEVDSDSVDDTERVLIARRQRFYRELGCRKVSGVSYLMPLVTGRAPPPMDLLIFGSDLPPKIERAVLQEWLEAMYVQVYQQPRNDARIHNMLAPLSDVVKLV